MMANRAHDDHELQEHVLVLRPRGAMRRFAVAAIVSLVSALALGAGGEAQAYDSVKAPVVLEGVAAVARPGCASDAYRVSFSMMDRGGEPWLGMRPLAVGVECDGISYGTLTWYTGKFNPKLGGCVTAADKSSRICLGSIPFRGVHQGVRFDLCFGATTCWRGTASLVRT